MSVVKDFSQQQIQLFCFCPPREPPQGYCLLFYFEGFIFWAHRKHFIAIRFNNSTVLLNYGRESIKDTVEL